MRQILASVAALALLAACDARRTTENIAFALMARAAAAPAALPAEASADTSAEASAARAQTDRDLETLRAVMDPYQDFAAATRAGWSLQVTSCVTDATRGGAGFHYGNPALIDGTVRADEPEVLLYEPRRLGGMQLVGVEYIVPLDRWHGAAPPRLFDREFTVNATLAVWTLHVWAWRANPSGPFADWNPEVSCESTTDIAATSTSAH